MDLQEEIISILEHTSSATAMQIHKALKYEKKYSKSYQNTFKTLTKMTKTSLKRENSTYSINQIWLENKITTLKETLSKIKNPITKKRTFKDELVEAYTFESLLEVDIFWVEFIFQEIKKQKNVKEVYWEGPNCWWLFANLANEEKYLRTLHNKKIKAKFILKQQNYLNKVSCEFYKMNGCEAKIKKDNSEDQYTHRGIVGTTIIEAKYDEEINNLLNKIFVAKNIIKFLENISRLAKIRKKIVVHIYRNSLFAQQIILKNNS